MIQKDSLRNGLNLFFCEIFFIFFLSNFKCCGFLISRAAYMSRMMGEVRVLAFFERDAQGAIKAKH